MVSQDTRGSWSLVTGNHRAEDGWGVPTASRAGRTQEEELRRRGGVKAKETSNYFKREKASETPF